VLGFNLLGDALRDALDPRALASTAPASGGEATPPESETPLAGAA
jgi:hypothetical protein